MKMLVPHTFMPRLYPGSLVLALRKNVNFLAFYNDEQFCGIMYTAEDDKYTFLLYLAVNDEIRSKGYGTKMLDWLKQNTNKIIVLDVEAINPSADNALQREKRISFYSRNGFFDTGYRFTDKGETYFVLASTLMLLILKSSRGY